MLIIFVSHSPALLLGEGAKRSRRLGLCNLPGWRWATITKVALDRLSRSLHSDVCDSDGLRDAAIHSTISGSGGRRERATSNISKQLGGPPRWPALLNPHVLEVQAFPLPSWKVCQTIPSVLVRLVTSVSLGTIQCTNLTIVLKPCHLWSNCNCYVSP